MSCCRLSVYVSGVVMSHSMSVACRWCQVVSVASEFVNCVKSVILNDCMPIGYVSLCIILCAIFHHKKSQFRQNMLKYIFIC